MNLKRIFAVSLVGALTMIGAVGLTSAQSSIDETLRIAVIAGENSEADQAAHQSAQMAAADINADEGVVAPNGTRYGFEVLFYEANTAAEVLEALEDAVDDDAVAIIGPSDPALAAALDDNGRPAVPVLLTASNSPTGNGLYRIAPDADAWAEAAADYLSEVRQFERIAVLTNDTDSAINAREAFNAALDDDLIAADLQFDSEAERFNSEAETIREEDVQAIFVWALDNQMWAISDALDAVGWEGVIVYAGLDSNFASRTSENSLTQMFGVTNWLSAALDADSQDFVEAYVSQIGGTLYESAALAYDAVSLIAAAVDSSGDQPASISTWLTSSGALDGVAGNYELSVSNTVRLFQMNSAAEAVEVAAYEDGTCLNCASIYAADTTDVDETASGTLRLGLITTGSTVGQDSAQSMEQAVRLAIREINAAGGMIDPDGTRYTFALNVYEADNAEEAEAAVQEAASDGVSVVLGPDSNGQVLPNLGDAESASILQFTSATSDEISRNESSGYVFQVRSTDSTLAQAAAGYLTETRAIERIATVAVNTDYGIDSIDAFSDAVDSSDDAEVILSLEHEVSELDLIDLAGQITDSGAEAVAVWTTQPAALNLLDALNAQGWNGLFVYGYLTPGFVESTAGTGIEIVGPVNWWSTAQDWTSRDFASRYRERFNDEPFPQTASYYDAIYLLQQAVTESGADVDSLQDWLEAQDSFVGVQGAYAPQDFSSSELTRSVLIVAAAGGQVTELSRYVDGACVSAC